MSGRSPDLPRVAQFAGLRAVFVIVALLTLTLLAGMTVVTHNALDAAERDVEHS